MKFFSDPAAPLTPALSRPLRGRRGGSFSPEKGSVLFYIFIAIGLLAALTYSFVQDSRQNTSSQLSYRASEDLYVQLNVIRSAVMECVIEYPGGGPDDDADGSISTTENSNNPFPINPSDPDNPETAQVSDIVRLLSCTGAPATKRNIFQGANNKGRLLPPPPTGFGEWTYHNDMTGVYLTIATANNAAAADGLSRLQSKFATCQASVATVGTTTTFTGWIQRVSCP